MDKKEYFEKVLNRSTEELVKEFFPNGITTKEKIGIRKLLESVVELVMNQERNFFLENDEDNKANGYYERNLNTGSFKLNINVPRDRKGKFRPQILPDPYKRVNEDYIDLLMSLVSNGYSESKIDSTLKSLGLNYSKQHMDKIKKELIERLNDFKTRELPSDAFVLYIDAYHCDIKEKNKIRKASVYVVLGIDLQGNKDIFGFYTFFSSENKADWIKVFNDLIDRGLKRVMLIVSDDFPGITKAIETLFPYTDHQLCLVHLQRNVRNQMDKEDSQVFNKELKNIKENSLDYEDGLEKLDDLCGRFKSKYPSFIKHIQSNKERYLCFLKYPENLRKHIYTTNPVESVNSMIEKVRINLGGYFQSVDILEINLLIQRDNLKNGKWKKPIPAFKGVSYEILQLFNKKFSIQTQNY